MLSVPATTSSTPDTVRAWFVEPLNDTTLSRYVAALCADPNWRAVQFQGGGCRTLKLLYFPTGRRLEVLLAWKAAHWNATRISPA